MKLDALRSQLDAVNERLAQLTGREPAAFSFQTGESQADMLFLYGILGGKDVGKTSLINLLAGARISIDTDLLDEGTNVCTAYCHEDDLPHLRQRLADETGAAIQYASHQRNELRHVVLIDFPDFDSRFDAHLEDVRKLGPYLQGIVWITSPRKYADHEFLDRLETVAQSHENLYVVMNKVDQLEGRATLEEIRAEASQVLDFGCDRAGIPRIGQGRVWLTSALHPGKYEFKELYRRLIRAHSLEEIARAKANNLKSEFEKNFARLHKHYELDRRIAEIDEALDYLQQAIGETFSEDYYQAVEQRVLSLEPINRRISSGVFYHRIDGWPILRTLFYPLSGLVSFIGGRFSFTPRASDWVETPQDVLRYQGQTAGGRMLAIQQNLEERFPRVTRQIESPGNFGEAAERRFETMLRRYEEQVVQRITDGVKPPGSGMKTLIYLPLIWFPFVQPMLFHLSTDEPAGTAMGEIGDLFGMVISLLGAGALLESLIFLALFYFLWLMALYARGTRRVLRIGQDELRDLWYEDYVPWAAEVFQGPLQRKRAVWIDLRAKLDGIEREVNREIDQLAQQGAPRRG
ncbi:MAG: hypothetical protein GC154_16275 [bacterium]|nr:hypothetical protein [bacterium]